MNLLENQYKGVFYKLFTILLCFFIPVFIGKIIISFIIQITGFTEFANLETLTSDMKYQIYTLKLIQFISSICTFVIPPLLIAKFLDKNDNYLGFLKLKSTPALFYYLLVVCFILASRPLLALIVEWNESIVFPSAIEEFMRSKEDANKHIMELILTGSGFMDLFINLLLIGLLPALGEELFFRGFIQKYLYKFTTNHHIAIFITSFIFSAIHFQFYGFVPRFLLGMFFGYMVYYSGSLWPAIFAHFINNGMAVIIYFFVDKNIVENINEFEFNTNTIILLVLGTLISVVLGRYLFRKKQIEL